LKAFASFRIFLLKESKSATSIIGGDQNPTIKTSAEQPVVIPTALLSTFVSHRTAKPTRLSKNFAKCVKQSACARSGTTAALHFILGLGIRRPILGVRVVTRSFRSESASNRDCPRGYILRAIPLKSHKLFFADHASILRRCAAEVMAHAFDGAFV